MAKKTSVTKPRVFTKIPITVWRKILNRAANVGNAETCREMGLSPSWLSTIISNQSPTTNKPPGVFPSTLATIMNWHAGKKAEMPQSFSHDDKPSVTKTNGMSDLAKVGQALTSINDILNNLTPSNRTKVLDLIKHV